MVKVESSSVGHAMAILRGFRMGNPQKAERFLNSMDPAALKERNRQESRMKVKVRKRHQLGARTWRQARVKGA